MPTIHPAAFVDPSAQLADDVYVGPMCYVGPGATIGRGTRLISHVSVLNRTTLGAYNTVWPQATLGADPQDLKFKGEDSELVVGDHNDIRENVTLHIGTANGGGATRVGDHNLFMVGGHVAHDCVVGSHVMLANGVLLAGHVHVLDHAIVSGGSAVHHYVTIGRYAFIGGMTRVVADVPSFMLVEGNPSRVRGVNVIGLERNHFEPQTIAHLKDAYRKLFRSADDDTDVAGSLPENLARIAALYPDDACVAELIAFLRDSSAGVFGRSRERQRHDNRHSNPAR